MRKNQGFFLSPLWKDALRMVRRSGMRFLALLLMTMLGAAVFVGLASVAPNMRLAVDYPIDQLKREEIRITSPLGLREKDKEILDAEDDVASYEWVYAGDFFLNAGEDAIIHLQSLTKELALPHILEGRAPENAGEILLDRKVQEKLGVQVGDFVTIHPEKSKKEEKKDEDSDDQTLHPVEEDRLKTDRFQVVGFADHVYYFYNGDRGRSLIGDGKRDFFGIILAQDFAKERPNMAILDSKSLSGTTSDPLYKAQEQALVSHYADLFRNRGQEIQAKLISDIQAKIDDGRKEIADGEQTIEDGRQKLADAKKDLDQAHADYADGERTFQDKIAEARGELDRAKGQLNDALDELHSGQRDYDQGLGEYEKNAEKIRQGEAQLKASQKELETGQAALDQAKAKLEAQGLTEEVLAKKEGEISAKERELDAGQAQIDAGYAKLPENYQEILASPQAPADLKQAVAALEAKQKALDAGRAQLAEGKAELAKLRAALEQVAAQEKKLSEGWASYEKAKADLAAGKAQLPAAQEKLQEAKEKLDAGWADYRQGQRDYRDGQLSLERKRRSGQAELEQAWQKIQDGEADYQRGLEDFQMESAEGQAKIDDAKREIVDREKKLSDLELPAYQVAGRYNDQYINIMLGNADNMVALTLIFPGVFYLIAVLTTITTIKRMVDEERTAIGTLKAMGFSRQQIGRKYLFYAGFSSALGSVLGIFFGFYVLMPTIFEAYTDGFSFLYPVRYELSPWTVVLALAIGLGLSLLSAYLSIRQSMRQRAAALIRPLTPANGHRILLERMSWIWTKLNFTAKVTMRNLTAKKSRMFMTLLGVLGSMALIVMGFGIRSSVASLIHKQYRQVQNYDIALVFDSEAEDADQAEILDYVQKVAKDWTLFRQEAGSFEDKDGVWESFQLLVVEDGESFHRLHPLRDRLRHKAISLAEDRALLTEPMARALGGKPEEMVMKNSKGLNHTLAIGSKVEQYVGHAMFVTPAFYQKSFDLAYKPNAVYLQLADGQEEDQVLADLQNFSAIQFRQSNQESQETIQSLIDAIGIVVYIIIFISGLLSFVVLYNLTNLNISERQRELATIRVLGFQHREVTAYVYRETLLLTAIGILLGALAGKILHYAICMALSPNTILIDPALNKASYFLGGGLVLFFSLVVMAIIHRILKDVDMVEALKADE